MAMTARNGVALLLAAALVVLSMPATAAIARLPMAFPDGVTRAVASGRIVGRASNDHIVRARAGQVLAVRLDADSAMAYFNVLPPGSDQAVFIGSTSGNEFRGVLASDGDFVIRVYLMPASARRGESSNYTLRVDLTNDPGAPLPRSNDPR
jgi:hypothetical protein